jgi:hypothetical protein
MINPVIAEVHPGLCIVGSKAGRAPVRAFGGRSLTLGVSALALGVSALALIIIVVLTGTVHSGSYHSCGRNPYASAIVSSSVGSSPLGSSVDAGNTPRRERAPDYSVGGVQ